MAVISIFRNSGATGGNINSVTEYLKSEFSALSDKQKKERAWLEQLIQQMKLEQADRSEIFDLRKQRNSIRGKRRASPPEILNDGFEQVEQILPLVPFKHKYISGVIAHAIEDTEFLRQNPHIEQEWRERFEDLCFAGLPQSDRLIGWVRHTDKGNVENHFVIPRIHLPTGKSFNPAPPRHERDFNILRDYLNLKYDLASPRDLRRRRLTQDNHRDIKNHKFREQVNNYILSELEKNTINCRQDIISLLNKDEVKQELGIEEAWSSENYVGISRTGFDKNVRMKGFIYSREFSSKEQLLAREPELLETKEEKLKTLKDKLDNAIRTRGEFNQDRYGLNLAVQSKGLHQVTDEKANAIDKSLLKHLDKPNSYLSIPSTTPSSKLSVLDLHLKGFLLDQELERRAAIALAIAAEQAAKQQLQLLIETLEILFGESNNNDRIRAAFDNNIRTRGTREPEVQSRLSHETGRDGQTGKPSKGTEAADRTATIYSRELNKQFQRLEDGYKSLKSELHDTRDFVERRASSISNESIANRKVDQLLERTNEQFDRLAAIVIPNLDKIRRKTAKNIQPEQPKLKPAVIKTEQDDSLDIK
ncbi:MULTISPECIES: relaxase family protein [Vibrio]|uniref:relaxase/mobilization nuclease domain-containing protein n=1 Tax=Vibrio TaxID=662 RepID=UPI00226E2A94|nr:relaxase/mobilization nuclease domain-containing protein [Vibrio cholerae]MCX9568765.1 relaxase/mobilization nuclease domain-containing protein [Vibrio cholerae]MCX9572193.1 relaxase/mobilization nuclease domain-containing protein [Vibrio cholerae]MCX9589755.1 relaxase/mobilization nuclease domain-containing protein [Vibrio cholerae]